MRLSVATFFLTMRYAPSAVAQTCSGVSGPFTLEDITGSCTYDVLLEEYTRQVFDVTGATCATGSDVTAKEDFDAKLMGANTGAGTAEEAAEIICKAMYDNAVKTPFTNAADKGDDLHFEQMFYNGLSEWQDEIETLYEAYDENGNPTATSVLSEDASKVREFYRGDGAYSRVTWPDITNFEESTCSSHAAMCCWPKDRQANDGNGNCATPYDTNCVDKDPADNTNLCYADLAKGNLSSGFDSDKGFAIFPEDNNAGEGAIHCHGFAWADDEYDTISRYKANNLFFVSMYDHLHQRGYAKNIPGMPMCGCLDQMPIVTRSDCTQVDLTEDWEMVYDGNSGTFTGHLVKVEVDFNACRGRGGRNNDLWAYAARLYDDERMTAKQFGKVGRVLTNDHDCYHATENAKAENGYITAYQHDESTWTYVAGRDELNYGEPFGREAFSKALFEQSLTKPSDPEAAQFELEAEPSETPIVMRVCPDCIESHKKIFYRRLTPAPEGFDILDNMLRHHSNVPATGNTWNVDFTLHSTYDDAKKGAHPWSCPSENFNYYATFTGNCSPTGEAAHNQYSNWWWFPGPRPNVAFYVNKPQNDGVQDYSDNGGVTRAVGFTDIDIGITSGLEGNALESDGTFHITGSGQDIWGYSDQFHYKSQPWEGDIDVSVHVTDFTNSWLAHSKAGIMLRSDNSPDATYAFAMLTGNDGIWNQYRRSKGNHANSEPTIHKTSPIQTSAWLRIVKKQETVEFYHGDGEEGWILQNTDTFFFPDDKFRVGLAVTSKNNQYLAEATFENYSVETYNFPTSAPSTSAAPTTWNPMVDINTQRDGQYSIDAGTGIEKIKGSGDGIWGSSDSFFFYNEQLPNTDLTVEMYIDNFHNWNLYGRGGIMIRDSNGASASNVFVGAAGGSNGWMQGAVLQSRSAAGQETNHHKMVFLNNNNRFYVKLDKVGSVVTAYYRATQEDAWVELGSTELVLTGTTIQVGRAVTAGSDVYNAILEMRAKEYSVGPYVSVQ